MVRSQALIPFQTFPVCLLDSFLMSIDCSCANVVRTKEKALRGRGMWKTSSCGPAYATELKGSHAQDLDSFIQYGGLQPKSPVTLRRWVIGLNQTTACGFFIQGL